MARIAISLCGEGRGHAARVCTLVERLGDGHRFVIATSAEALDFLAARFGDRGNVRLIELPGIRFRYVGGRIDVKRTILDGLDFRFRALPRLVDGLVRELDRFAPDLAICDFEPVLPRAARWLGVPLASVDHQHFLAAYDLGSLPPRLRLTARIMGLTCGLFVPGATAHVISAFFRPPLLPGWRHATQAGPLLRGVVLAAAPHEGRHLLAYLRRHTPARVLEAIAAAGVPVRVYGLGARTATGRVSFHEIHEDRFVDDLASCRGVVAAAGNQLIGEALHLGKPLFVLPEREHAEQTMNAHFLAAAGCGEFVPLDAVTAGTVRGFLDRRGRFAAALAERTGRMDGLPTVAAVINRLLDRAAGSAPAASLRGDGEPTRSAGREVRRGPFAAADGVAAWGRSRRIAPRTGWGAP